MKQTKNTVIHKGLADISSDYRLNFLCEFYDDKLEDEFIHSTDKLLDRIRISMLALAAAFFCMICFDLLFYETMSIYVINSFVCRSAVLFVASLMYFILPKARNTNEMFLFESLFEISLIAAYFIIVFSPLNIDYFIAESMSMIVMVLCFFLMPNRFIYSLTLSVVAAVAFMIMSVLVMPELGVVMQLKSMLYLFAVIVISGISDYSIRSNKRKQFIKEKIFQKMMVTDRLTGIYNRLKFDEEITKCWNKDKTLSATYSVAMMDIDNFKQVNDVYGHLTGDDVLRELTSRIYSILHSGDVFARWGGEEFVILIVNSNEEESIRFAEKIRCLIWDTPFDDVGKVSVSIGVSQISPEDDTDSVMLRVDSYLYTAKKTGKNKVIHGFSPELKNKEK